MKPLCPLCLTEAELFLLPKPKHFTLNTDITMRKIACLLLTAMAGMLLSPGLYAQNNVDSISTVQDGPWDEPGTWEFGLAETHVQYFPGKLWHQMLLTRDFSPIVNRTETLYNVDSAAYRF